MKRFIITSIAILLMMTGPVLMVLPGPQILSWIGLGLFIYANKDWLRRYKWFRSCEFKLRIYKIDRHTNKQHKHIYHLYRKQIKLA